MRAHRFVQHTWREVIAMSHSHHLAAPTPASGADGNITGTTASALIPFSRYSRHCVSTTRLRRLSTRRLCASIPQLQR
jgi:hypothetical protein